LEFYIFKIRRNGTLDLPKPCPMEVRPLKSPDPDPEDVDAWCIQDVKESPHNSEALLMLITDHLHIAKA
jgi:hypothetical protein